MTNLRRFTSAAAGVLLLPIAAVVGSSAAAAGCTVVGSPDHDVLVGTARADVLCGFGGNDVLRGLGGNDVLRGGDGNDTLLPGRGSNIAQGNAGVDTLSYTDVTSGSVFVDLTNGSVTRAVNDEVATVENVMGTEDGDRIVGSAGRNQLFGRGGNDFILGAAGDDHLFGADGNDTLYPGLGSNDVRGQGGVDILTYEDLLTGNVHVDIPNGTVTRTVNDTIAGLENVFGTARNDRIIGGDVANRLFGFDGNDVIFGGLGDDELRGGEGTDRIHPGGGDDFANGGNGTDMVSYQELDHSWGVTVELAAGWAKDSYPNQNTDAGTDTALNFEDVFGTWDRDTLMGTDGPNYINAAYGNDVVYPRLGKDRLVGGGHEVSLGDPTIGEGDTVDYSEVTGVGVNVNLITHVGPGGGSIDGFETIFGTEQNDTIVSSGASSYISALGGADQVEVRSACSSINGGPGDDVLKPAPSVCDGLDQHINGGEGQDTASYTHATSAIRLVPGNHYWSTEGFSTAFLSGIEVVRGTSWADDLIGGLDEILVTFYGRGGSDDMDTTDGFGGDSMIQDGVGSATTCAGDPTDNVDC
jgi:Ca2+-binding RTX toxin-like protein